MPCYATAYVLCNQRLKSDFVVVFVLVVDWQEQLSISDDSGRRRSRIEVVKIVKSEVQSCLEVGETRSW